MLSVELLLYGAREMEYVGTDKRLEEYAAQHSIINHYNNGLSETEITKKLDLPNDYASFVINHYQKSTGFAIHLTG